MYVLLLPVGSAGDVHPFIGLGAALRRRGHDVTVAANAYFENLVRRTGLDFAELGTLEEYDAITSNPDLWHPRKGARAVLEWGGLNLFKPMYELVTDLHRPGETVVVCAGLAMGARIAQEKLGFPMTTAHIAPYAFWSEHRPPVTPGGTDLSWLPRPVLRAIYRGAIAWIDLICAERTNRFRRSVGLPPIKRIFAEWWLSPQRVIGLFPDWFADYQPDWPPQVRLTGFPQYDENDVEPPTKELSAFLDDGTPPIVFTPGSSMRHGEDFFTSAIEACRRLGRRGILLTRYPEQLPDSLPSFVRHFDFAPFSRLLPRAAALVHHGGIGSVGQALAAGIPQLIMPMGFDQPDNASRLIALGVADMIPRRAFRARLVAKKLSRLLGDPQVALKCRALARRFRNVDPVRDTCALIEQLDPTSRSSAA